MFELGLSSARLSLNDEDPVLDRQSIITYPMSKTQVKANERVSETIQNHFEPCISKDKDIPYISSALGGTFLRGVGVYGVLGRHWRHLSESRTPIAARSLCN